MERKAHNCIFCGIAADTVRDYRTQNIRFRQEYHDHSEKTIVEAGIFIAKAAASVTMK